MAGRGPSPKDQRVRTVEPERGEVVAATATGWQHGVVPPAPDGLMPASSEAWSTWMAAWFASFWSPADIPGLRQLVRLYDEVERGEFVRASELRLQMDTYGITPKGQQDRRWKPAVADTKPAATSAGGVYGHLQVVPTAV